MRQTTLLILVCLALVLVDAKKKKPKPKPPTKGACATLGPKPAAKIFTKYTEKNKKCPCWWDITRNDCACCTSKEYQQCGWPMHKYCYKKAKKGKPQIGCPGVCNNQWTLSGKGFPCSADHDDKDCAWCTTSGYQCAQDKVTGPDSKAGSRCANSKNQNYCKSQQGDCKHIPACDVNAECKFKEKVSRYVSYWQCECEKGFTGNGIQCMDGNGTLSLPSDLAVEVDLVITNDEYTYPYNGEFGMGEKMELLYQEMGEVAGSVCNGDNCQSTYNQTEQNN